MFGIQQDKQIRTIKMQKEQIEDLHNKIAIWEEDYQKLNDPN